MSNPLVLLVQIVDADVESPAMKRAYKISLWWAFGLSAVTFVIWPLLTLPAGGTWSLGYFTFWIILSIVWGLVAGLIVTFYPLIESRKVIFRILTCRPKRSTHSVPSSSSLSSNESEAQGKVGNEVPDDLQAHDAKLAPPEEVSIKIPK
ncbi:g4687 [Coccomyxa elongata]